MEMRVIKLAKNNLEKLDNELQDKVKKRVKQEHARLSYFPNQSLGARYLEVNFSQNVRAVLKESVRYI